MSALLALAILTAAAQMPLIHFSFDSDRLPPEFHALPSGISVESGWQGSRSLRVARPAAEGAGALLATATLPVEKLRGRRIRVSGMVKAEQVARPPNPWNGVKVMLHVECPRGDQWPQRDNLHGTFDWRRIRYVAAIPEDATRVTLVLGLENTTGTAWFDDISLEDLASHAAPGAGPPYKGHSLPRLRGAMIGNVNAEDLRHLGNVWKANHVRWQLVWDGFPRSPADSASLAEYNVWIEGQLKRLDALLPVCREAGLLVLIDLHTPPGGRTPDSQCRIFTDRTFQERFVSLWEEIARRYRGNKTVWGYDLVNEPVEGMVAADLMDWQELAEHTARRIRAIDPDHAIVIEPAPWGAPNAIDNLEPLTVPGVVYSVHMYEPHLFTHQGVYDNPKGVMYPGEIQGRKWDKEALRQVLQPTRDFQRRHNVHIYIGEFSAIRWAPGNSALNYLRDVIEIVEEYGWDWAYHAYREWDGWSVEHDSNPDNRERTAVPTDREKLLRSYFDRNKKPSPR